MNKSKYSFDTSAFKSERIFFEEFKVVPAVKEDVIPIEYNYNSYGYRSPEFTGKEDLMVLGCSYTMGDGLPEEFMWSNQLAQKTNLNHANLSLGGDSIPGQVMKAFNYFKNFGHPKIIVGLFPLYRMPIPTFMGNNVASKYKNTPIKNETIIQSCNLKPGLMTKYAKNPFDPEEVLSPEVAIFYGHRFISILEQYCKANNIVFLWSIWENYKEIYDYYKDIDPEFYKNYCNIEANQWQFDFETNQDLIKICNCFIEDGSCDFHADPFNVIKCHLEYKDDILFHRAADIKNGLGHWGIHRNIHIAEDFYSELKLRGVLK